MTYDPTATIPCPDCEESPGHVPGGGWPCPTCGGSCEVTDADLDVAWGCCTAAFALAYLLLLAAL